MDYLASPFTDVLTNDETIEHQRYLDTLLITTIFHTKGEFVYSPIVHHYSMYKAYNLQGGFEHFRIWDFHMIALSEKLRILKLAGWEYSRGVREESDLARALLLPIVEIDFHKLLRDEHEICIQLIGEKEYTKRIGDG